ncbi:SSU ribosomal protein S4p (S9e) [Candidatus Vidania fulgoroideae]|nr:SSU ribosomal protein S4p (S9e) [Candidatus Vidania fulgoroideae]
MRVIKKRAKLTRKEGTNLELFSKKKIIKKNNKKNKFLRVSEYKKKIREFSKIKTKYCINNGNFKSIVRKIGKRKKKFFIFIKILETRLDNILYRIGFFGTRREARQSISHKKIFVNGKNINKPSYSIKKNDIITAKKKKQYKNQISKFSFTNDKLCKIKSLGFYKNYCSFFNSFYVLSILNK